MLEERRRLRRVVFPFKVSVTSEGEEIDVFHTENVSLGGIRILSQKKLSHNAQVDVTLDLGNHVIISSGKVAWFMEVKPSEQQQSYLYDIGIEFVGMDAGAKKALEDAVGTLHDRTRA